MSIVTTIKRAPRWAWWTSGGLILGVAVIKVYKGRAADATSGDTAGDGSTVGDVESGSTQPATTGSSPPGVIVPPIITGGDTGVSGDIAGAFGGLLGTLVDDLSGMLGTVVTGDQAVLAGVLAGQQETNNAVIDLLAGGGVAPQPVKVQGTVVVTQTPTPSPSHPQGGAQQYPTWSGHTLWWWRQPHNARKNNQWKWPGGGGYTHTRAFEGHTHPTGHTTNPHK